LWIKYPWDANDILAHTEAERQMFEDNKELRYG
ncbi:MAG: phosphoribosyltransferase, partial [Spirochaetales bacterium]|nr:phosphoribosyltransferase [Spirochaetales bacterium]